MNAIKTLVVAAALSVLGFASGSAQAAETLKPLQGVSFHTETKDAVAYYLADKGTCKVVVTITDKASFAPTRFEEGVEARNSALLQIDEGNSLQFACQGDAQSLTINMLTRVAQH